MGVVKVELCERSYNIHIEPGILAKAGEFLSLLPIGKKVMVITNKGVGELYGSTLIKSLKEHNFNVTMREIPEGEEYKNLETVKALYSDLLKARMDRESSVIALGGGVVGDVAGFAAATFMRGIHFVQIPTTLLAQVDSSVGGKVGVNLDEAKNMVGAFYQPIIVLIDPDLLRTLPRREIRAGLAEVIKYGMIRDQELFVFLEESIGKILSFDIQSITNVIMRSCRIKAEVVSKDEKERGYRAILNYGHTVAHAIETLTQYRTFLHGEAVAIGMVTEAKVAVLLGIFGETEERRQTELIKRAGLPTRLEGVDPNRIIDVIKLDKKVRDEEPRFVLPRRIGDVIIRGNIENGLIFEALRELMG